MQLNFESGPRCPPKISKNRVFSVSIIEPFQNVTRASKYAKQDTITLKNNKNKDIADVSRANETDVYK